MKKISPLSKRNSLEIANDIIRKGEKEGIYMSAYKLTKIIYLTAGRYMAAYDEPLLLEDFYAWSKGADLVSLYQIFNSCKGKLIYRPVSDLNGLAWFTNFDEPSNYPYMQILDSTWQKYKNFSDEQLWKLLCKDDAWGYSRCNTPINNEEIKKFFITKKL